MNPSRRDRLRPAELLGVSGGLALFVGLVVVMSTRDIVLGLIGLGITFILTVVTIAMLALSTAPDREELRDLGEQDHGAGH